MSPSARRPLLGRLGYERTRSLLTVGGVFLLVLISGVLAIRGVDRVEIIAALLYIPVFLVFLVFGLKGGVIAGIAAGAAYMGLRYSAAEIVGFDRFVGLIGFRAIAYIAFGTIGGWAAEQLDTPLKKLEQHDLIDDATGLFNARFFVRETAVETARADRYGTSFSVVAFDVPSVDGNGKDRDVQEIGRLLRRSLRTVDRAVHADTGTGSLFAAILPETPAAGARTVAEKIGASMTGALGEGASDLRSFSLSYPEEKAAFAELKERFQTVDRREHPEDETPSPEPGSPERRGPEAAP